MIVLKRYVQRRGLRRQLRSASAAGSEQIPRCRGSLSLAACQVFLDATPAEARRGSAKRRAAPLAR